MLGVYKYIPMYITLVVCIAVVEKHFSAVVGLLHNLCACDVYAVVVSGLCCDVNQTNANKM